MGFKVIDIQPTPNPNAMKFLLGSRISEQTISFFDASAATGHPLAKRLFEIRGVTGLLLLGDFVTINKSPAGRWDDIKREARAILRSAS